MTGPPTICKFPTEAGEPGDLKRSFGDTVIGRLVFSDRQRVISLAMVDTRSPEQRRYIMQAVGVEDTGPEVVVRKMLHALGYRYRLHVRTLPGRPDLVFPIRRKAIFVHGCFWHGHGCAKGQPPKSRLDYWGPKIETNRARDTRNLAELQAMGWDVLVVWQCEMRDPGGLKDTLISFLGDRQKTDRGLSPRRLASGRNRS